MVARRPLDGPRTNAARPIVASMNPRIADLAGGALRYVRRDRKLLSVARQLKGAVAIEPGGPSALFGRDGPVPVYRTLAAVDTLDFSERTIWSEQPQVEAPIRRRLIGEAGHIDAVTDDSYDALLASHVIEHMANPLGALAEWQRVVRPGGHLLLVVPHREGTFDHRRPITSLEHIGEDAEQETGEDDASHLAEILELHDLSRDPGAPSRQIFESRCRENASLRAMHHHVFDSRSVVELCRAAQLTVLELRPKLPFNIVCLCRVDGDSADALTDDRLAKTLAASPFSTDRNAS
jgi:SAM-dependent methyltransferase